MTTPPRVRAVAFYVASGMLATFCAALASEAFTGVTAKRWAWAITGVSVSVVVGLLHAFGAFHRLPPRLPGDVAPVNFLDWLRRVWPHRYRAMRGTPTCARCGVHYAAHKLYRGGTP